MVDGLVKKEERQQAELFELMRREYAERLIVPYETDDPFASSPLLTE